MSVSPTQVTLSPGLLTALSDSDQNFLAENFLPAYFALQNLAANGGEDHRDLQKALAALSGELEAAQPKPSRIKKFWQTVRDEADALQGLGSAADLISKAALGIGLILAAI